MPQFFFHLANGTYSKDKEGEPYPTFEEACNCALDMARDLGRNQTKRYVTEHSISVTDEEDREVFRTPLKDE